MKRKQDNKEFKIVDNVPPPTKAARKKYGHILKLLKVGQSVYIPTNRSGAASRASAILGVGNYMSAIEGDGTRIWRTK